MSRCWLRCRAMLSTLGTGASMAKRRRVPPNLGQAISYRLKRDGRGWRVFVSTRMMDVPVVTDQRRGAIGVDLNADHLAVAETDASGNCLNAWRVPLVPYGKSTHQAEALIGDAVASVVAYARKMLGKPIVIEEAGLSSEEGHVLEGENRKYSRMLVFLSAYGKGQGVLHLPGAWRQGVVDSSGEPGLQFSDRAGQVHGTIWAQCPSGCGLGAGPSFTRLLRAHPTPVGLSHWQWRPCRLHRTCKEASEARVDVLGCGSLGQLRPALAAQHRLDRQRRRSNPAQAGPQVQACGVA